MNRLALLFLAIGASIAIVACPDAANVDDEGGGTPTPAPQPTPPSTTPTPEPPPASMGVVRQYLPRLSGAEIGDDWSKGEETYTLQVGRLDEAARTLQVHDWAIATGSGRTSIHMSLKSPPEGAITRRNH